jgi:DNA-binding Lrp family transcriptional regulator
MKNIRPKLVSLFKEGYCTPQISKIAVALKEPSSTIHYNIKKLESEGAVKAYKAVFDHAKIDEGFCVYVLINISPEYYDTPIAEELAKLEEVESAATIAGEWDVILKIRTKTQNEYYQILRKHLLPKGVTKTLTLTTLKDIKTDYVFLET